jgi:hypothetical protein
VPLTEVAGLPAPPADGAILDAVLRPAPGPVFLEVRFAAGVLTSTRVVPPRTDQRGG